MNETVNNKSFVEIEDRFTWALSLPYWLAAKVGSKQKLAKSPRA